LAHFNLFHAAVGFRNTRTNDQWTVEYDAVPDLFGALIPTINNNTLEWENQGGAIVYHSINTTYWSSTNEVVAQINGTIHNVVLKWLYNANVTHPVYNMFNVMNQWSTDRSTYYLQSQTCADFQFEVFDYLAYLGTKFYADKPLKKDDVNLYAKEKPELVVFEKGSKHYELILAFYELVTVKFKKMEHLSVLEVIHEIFDLLQGDIYLHHDNDYYLVKLHWPEFNWKYFHRPVVPVNPTTNMIRLH
jgi:hypothetical protein